MLENSYPDYIVALALITVMYEKIYSDYSLRFWTNYIDLNYTKEERDTLRSCMQGITAWLILANKYDNLIDCVNAIHDLLADNFPYAPWRAGDTMRKEQIELIRSKHVRAV